VTLLTACPQTGSGTPTAAIDFTASNWNPVQGEVVVFTVKASVSQGDITLCEIWFDGGPSEIHYFKSPTISTTFSHAYLVPGSYMVRVQLQNENGSIGSQEKLLTVSAGPV
jgi:hypothetical protein